MKNIFSRMLNSLPKRLLAGAAVAMAIALPAASLAADLVTIEGSIGVANITKGDTKYSRSVNANYDQVVKFQVYYHNRELPNSGKVAKNLSVKINMPNQVGQTQNVSTTIKADNSNTVTDTASVNIDRSDASLQFIPGSVNWRHNTGTNQNLKIVDTKLPDSLVTSGHSQVIENEKPCYNFSATITFYARVIVPGVKIVKQSEVLGQSNKWSNNNTAKPGDTLKYMIAYQNIGNSVENKVAIGDNLPPKMELVKGTTKVYNSRFPNGTPDNSENIANGGIYIGNYNPGATAYVVFEVKVPAESQLACGTNEFRNVGVAQPQGMTAYYNTAITTVNKVCNQPNQPSYSCTLLDVNQGSNRTVTVSGFQYSAQNGAKFKSVDLNWGDSSAPLTTNNVVGQTHTYEKDGTYTVSAVAHFDVNGKDLTVDGAQCSKTVSFTSPTAPTTPTTPQTPSQLPNTGAGSVAEIFGGIVAASSLAYRYILGRKLARQ